MAISVFDEIPPLTPPAFSREIGIRRTGSVVCHQLILTKTVNELRDIYNPDQNPDAFLSGWSGGVS